MRQTFRCKSLTKKNDWPQSLFFFSISSLVSLSNACVWAQLLSCVQLTHTCEWAQSLSCVRLFTTPGTARLLRSMGLSQQEYWSGLPFPPPGDLPDPGIKSMSPESPALVSRFLTTEPPGEQCYYLRYVDGSCLLQCFPLSWALLFVASTTTPKSISLLCPCRCLQISSPG